ncbi:MAG: biotin transporter BioY, partial [Burkholderiales bacterium]
MQTRELVGAALFAVLTALGALFTIPLVPVPITLQTFFTYLAGGILGARAGALSQLIYVLLGVAG